MSDVERVTTPLSRQEMGEALITGHHAYFGTMPSLARLSVAWSQCALEHAAGAKLYNFNFGNVTAGAKWQGDSYVMHVPPPDPPILRFRAFPSAELGAIDYWEMLDQHYAPALRLFDWGNAYDACILLGRLGYFTADAPTYATAVKNYKAWFDANLASAFADELAEGKGNSLLSQSDIDATLDRVAAGIAQEVRTRPDSPAALRNADTEPDLGDPNA